MYVVCVSLISRSFEMSYVCADARPACVAYGPRWKNMAISAGNNSALACSTYYISFFLTIPPSSSYLSILLYDWNSPSQPSPHPLPPIPSE